VTHTVIGVSPFGAPDPRLASAVCRAGGLGVLDLGSGARGARAALTLARRWTLGRHGVRVPADCALRPEELWTPALAGARRTAQSAADPAAGPCAVLLACDAPWTIAGVRAAARAAAADPAVLAEVRSAGEAARAVADGATGLVVRGDESGGPCGELSTFVLLQCVLDAVPDDLPVWACGGIGPHTAAAAVLAGARGVVLDVQLALLDEADTDPAAAGLLRTADGSETVVADGHRVLDRSRPGLLAALRDQPLPLGQDAFLAARFAERYGTVARALAAVMDGIDAAVAADGAVLRGGSRMCRALGTALPVAQGPMTRVSDQPRFAAAVADGGGLPFIALALAGPEQTRTLLEQTKSALGDRPWGVGVLGFAPEEVRTAQLEAVRELRPSHVVVAGGRPSQAAALEAEGIRTFLHVPSPGLLGQFLAAGARRFVFEGAECGGHIGPRNSFPLWEAQLAVLEDFLDTVAADGDAVDPQDVHVLFAGGIHDERSAAMVAALAAPLTARGAAVGVLMGTAYLFTEEAVECGAIRPLFQRAILDAESTALLHTAPGHATRCVPSAFSDMYQEVKDELRAQGIPERQAWQELERLNVGRLRIATKGVERVGDELLDVDEERQCEAGVFMAGEVAVLRSAVTTVVELHHAVADRAADFYERRTVELAACARDADGTVPAESPAPVPEPLDIAVVGMAGMFPGAADLPAYWAQVLAGADAVTEIPDTRWDPALHFGADAGADDVSTSKWGGFLPPIPFDPLAYGIPPASLASIEPVQLLALEAARRALADAGLDRRPFPRERTCVVFGAEAGSDTSGATTLRTVLPSYVGRLPEDLEEQLPKLTEDSFPGMLANVISGRIANRLDLGGANFTVDAACASSLAAVDVACKELAGGAADMALCGGADLHNGINDYLLFSSVHALSPTGRCRPFAADADGIALGEGVACVVLKRRADAERDGDRIYAVIKGVGSASDGRSLGLTAPRPEGQRAALERAYAQARVSPADVGLIEAHGTGTVVGDRTELGTLTRLLEEAGAAPGACVVGSVKSQIGHTKCAAGLAGLIKTALALHTGVRPPTLHIDVPNPAWTGPASPLAFHREARPWAESAGRRVAGVSAFGFGGTNFHVVLRAHAGAGAPPRQGHDAWPAELFVFRARTAVEEIADLAVRGHWRLRDLARTAARRAETGAGPLLGAVVAESVAELPQLLRDLLDGVTGKKGVFPAVGTPAGVADGDRKVAFLFPGQGSQRPGMFAELFTAFPELGRHLRHTSAAALYPPAAFNAAERAAQAAQLTDTRCAQPALGAVGLAAYDTLTAVGVRPDMAAGHSYGELVALCAAGALDPDTLGDLSRERAEAILAATGAHGQDPGTMAATMASAEQVTRVLAETGLADRVVTANHNAPTQSVLSGPTDAVAEAVDALTGAGFAVRPLPVACAFHSPLVAGAVPRFAQALATYPVRGPEFPVWANLTGTRYAEDPAEVRVNLTEQIAAPVRFAEQIEAMYDAGARIFVECGPGTVLTGLVGQILGDRPHLAVPFEPRPDAGLRGHLEALARLAAAGVPVAPGRLFAGRDAALADPAAVPGRPGWTVDGHLVRTADGEPVPGALRPARRTTGISRTREATTMGEREELLREFLRNSREMLAAQRDVLLGYFGAPDAPQPAPRAAEPLPAPASAHAPAPVGVDVLAEVVAVIAERTGYPAEMVGAELDLEADLSVDSIKRMEIAGELGQRLLGSGADLRSLSDAELEELTRARTAAGIADWLRARMKVPAAPDPAPASLAVPEPVAPETASGPGTAPAPAAVVEESSAPFISRAPKRYLLRPAPLDPAPAPGADAAAQLRGKRFLIVAGSTPLAQALVTRLTALGALAACGGPDAAELAGHTGSIDGVLHLGAVPGTDQQLLPAGFTALQELLLRGPRWLLCPRHPEDTSGLDGFVRTAAREHPDTVVRTVELDPDWPAAVQAEALVGELLAPDREPVVLHTGGTRRAPVPYEKPLGLLASSGAGPAASGAAEAAALGLGPESIVVLAGGARGITARFAIALAGAARCRVELLGRTPLDEGPAGCHEFTGATDRPALRAALAARGGLRPAEIDREAGRILARREVAATLAEVHDAGGQAGYRAVDLRDAEAVQQAVKEIYATYGRIDGIVHAAGVIEDRLLAEKDQESFARVYGTKVDGARTLLAALRRLPQLPCFTVLFGSVAAVYGNRGQADYAAANDALARLGRRWRTTTGSRTVTVHWGPWAPTGAHGGMIGPELGREYARRGIELIDPEEGVLALLRELAWGEPETDEVILTASGW
jgi:acyl transferase domain-containing protein/NAD(P)H-dependent flavin oxidoreductase YrpB (nitropropane dioxygenase family)